MTPRQRSYGRGRLVRKTRNGVEYGNYLAKYPVAGGERQESTGTTDLAAATRFLNDRMGSVAAGRAPATGMHRVTIGDLLNDLIARHEVEKAPGLRTTRTHKVALQPLAAIRAVDLTLKHLQRFVTDCRKHGYAEATVGRFLDTLKTALNDGRKARPPKLITLPEFPNIDESGNVRQGFATVEQRHVILGTLNGIDPDLGDTVEWKFWTGMRKGAIARIGWDSWDYETEMFRLPPAGRKKRTPKSIPLREGHPLRAIIDRRWQRRKDRAKETGRLEPLVFWRIHKGAPTKTVRPGDAVPVYEYRKAWDTAVEAAGCPNLTPHDLRRTAIRNIWLATRDRRMVKLLSAHATDSMVDRYNIETTDDLANALDAVAAHVAALDAKGDGKVVPLRRKARRAGGGKVRN
jgi:integrase